MAPHFRYCCSVWSRCGTTNINQNRKLQSRAARIVLNRSYDSPSGPLIPEWSYDSPSGLGWKTIRELVNEESRSMVYKSLNGLAPQYMRNLFTGNSTSNSRRLRNTETDFRLPKTTSANEQQCFSFHGAKLWNSLPAENKQAFSINIFKHSL